jgi:hypothetical protein
MFLVSTSDKISVITDAAVTTDVQASYADYDGSAVTPGRKNSAITTATTTDVVLAPASSVYRKVKTLGIRNRHATTSVGIIVQHTDGTTVAQLWAGTLLAGEVVCYIEGVGWQYFAAGGAPKVAATKLNTILRVISDVINATTSFADVTGLTVPLLSGRKYNFEAHLFHVNDATTTGSRFGYNIGAAPTLGIIGTIDTVTPSVTAAAMSAGVTATRDVAATAQTTGSLSQRLAILSGFVQPSADGTFAIRCASEIAVAAGLTVKAGSFLWIRETDNG